MKTTLEPPDSALAVGGAAEAPDFSLALGGPLFQLYRRTHLSGDGLELLRRRITIIPLLAWLPLLFLSTLEGHAFRGGLRIPFLYDIETHVRFLVALPLLIASEVIVHQRIGPSLRQFVERRIVMGEDLPSFHRAVISAVRLRNSIALEVTLLALVYTIGLWTWRTQFALGETTWYATHLHLSLAGYWLLFVSIPIFQFILMRWYMRLVIWFRLLWQISRLNLHLSAAHPDRAGGIGFVGRSSYAFGPILFAQGTLLSGLIASRVLYEGRNLLSFKMQAGGLVVFFLLAILGPLVMFTPSLSLARRKGAREYGLLANRYVFGFEDKWTRASEPETSKLLGTADIQAMSDMANVYSNVRRMRIVPFGKDDILRLAAATTAPLLPLALTVISVGELLKLLMKIVFH